MTPKPPPLALPLPHGQTTIRIHIASDASPLLDLPDAAAALGVDADALVAGVREHGVLAKVPADDGERHAARAMYAVLALAMNKASRVQAPQLAAWFEEEAWPRVQAVGERATAISASAAPALLELLHSQKSETVEMTDPLGEKIDMPRAAMIAMLEWRAKALEQN